MINPVQSFSCMYMVDEECPNCRNETLFKGTDGYMKCTKCHWMGQKK